MITETGVEQTPRLGSCVVGPLVMPYIGRASQNCLKFQVWHV